ncbi:basic proline-rich protein-like [Myotis yumanensis]|uniref:basic proline-rich protein-like n=1 Tax=Myotis yumanensis TaxID=159337 RepID=UPI0038CF6595
MGTHNGGAGCANPQQGGLRAPGTASKETGGQGPGTAAALKVQPRKDRARLAAPTPQGDQQELPPVRGEALTHRRVGAARPGHQPRLRGSKKGTARRSGHRHRPGGPDRPCRSPRNPDKPSFQIKHPPPPPTHPQKGGAHMRAREAAGIGGGSRSEDPLQDPDPRKRPTYEVNNRHVRSEEPRGVAPGVKLPDRRSAQGTHGTHVPHTGAALPRGDPTPTTALPRRNRGEAAAPVRGVGGSSAGPATDPRGSPAAASRAGARPPRGGRPAPPPPPAAANRTPAGRRSTSPRGLPRSAPLPGPRPRTAGPTPSGRRVRERAALTKAAAAAPSCRGAWTPGHSSGRGGRGDPGPALPSAPRPPRPQAPHRARQQTARTGSPWGCLPPPVQTGPTGSRAGADAPSTALRPRPRSPRGPAAALPHFIAPRPPPSPNPNSEARKEAPVPGAPRARRPHPPRTRRLCSRGPAAGRAGGAQPGAQTGTAPRTPTGPLTPPRTLTAGPGLGARTRDPSTRTASPDPGPRTRTPTRTPDSGPGGEPRTWDPGPRTSAPPAAAARRVPRRRPTDRTRAGQEDAARGGWGRGACGRRPGAAGRARGRPPGRGSQAGAAGPGGAGAAALTSALVPPAAPAPRASASAAAPGGGGGVALRPPRALQVRGEARSGPAAAAPLRARARRRLRPPSDASSHRWARRPLSAASGNPTAASPRTPRARTTRPLPWRAHARELPPAGPAHEAIKGAAPSPTPRFRGRQAPPRPGTPNPHSARAPAPRAPSPAPSAHASHEVGLQGLASPPPPVLPADSWLPVPAMPGHPPLHREACSPTPGATPRPAGLMH